MSMTSAIAIVETAMSLHHYGRSLASSSTSRPTSVIKRALSQASSSRAKRARSAAGTRPSISASRQSSSRQTPAGTPAPTQLRHGSARRADSNEDSELYDHVIFAVDQVKKTLGCAYYVAQNGRLSCMEDIEIEAKDAVDIR